MAFRYTRSRPSLWSCLHSSRNIPIDVQRKVLNIGSSVPCRTASTSDVCLVWLSWVLLEVSGELQPAFKFGSAWAAAYLQTKTALFFCESLASFAKDAPPTPGLGCLMPSMY